MSKSTKTTGTKKTSLQKAQARNASRQVKLKAKADAIRAAGNNPEPTESPVADPAANPTAASNPLLTTKGSDFTAALNDATTEQMQAALDSGTLSAKNRSRVETALANRKKQDDTGEQAAAEHTAPAGPDALGTAVTAAAAEGKKHTSGLDAAVQVLAAAGRPLTTGEMVEQMLTKGLWTTSGKTPAATIYSAILREINVKGADSRFRKTDRGHFELTAAATR